MIIAQWDRWDQSSKTMQKKNKKRKIPQCSKNYWSALKGSRSAFLKAQMKGWKGDHQPRQERNQKSGQRHLEMVMDCIYLALYLSLRPLKVLNKQKPTQMQTSTQQFHA